MGVIAYLEVLNKLWEFVAYLEVLNKLWEFVAYWEWLKPTLHTTLSSHFQHINNTPCPKYPQIN